MDLATFYTAWGREDENRNTDAHKRKTNWLYLRKAGDYRFFKTREQRTIAMTLLKTTARTCVRHVRGNDLMCQSNSNCISFLDSDMQAELTQLSPLFAIWNASMTSLSVLDLAFDRNLVLSRWGKTFWQSHLLQGKVAANATAQGSLVLLCTLIETPAGLAYVRPTTRKGYLVKHVRNTASEPHLMVLLAWKLSSCSCQKWAHFFKFARCREDGANPILLHDFLNVVGRTMQIRHDEKCFFTYVFLFSSCLFYAV